MSSAISTSIPSTEAAAEEVTFRLGDANFQELFILSYRKGGDILHLYFRHPNKDGLAARDYFRTAIERAKRHCEIMRYRFLFCSSYITDLDAEEKRMAM